MTMARPGPTVRRRQLGRKLRELRVAAGKSVQDAASFASVTQPTISRIEAGKTAILPKNVKLLCQCYGIGAPLLDNLLRQAKESNERGWWASYSDTMPDWFETYVGLESDAEELLLYQPELIPGIFQTADYVRAVHHAAQPDADPARVDKAVTFRHARQRRLDSNHPPRLHVVLNEAALRRVVGGPTVMSDQLRVLLEMSSKPHVTIQVLPFDAGAHASMTGGFNLLRFEDELEMNVAYLEHDHGAIYLERPADLDRYATIFAELTRSAITPDKSRDVLTNLKTQYDRATERGHG